MAYDPETTALLLVDPYNDFLSEGGKVWPRMQAIAEEVKLLDHLRAPVAPPREKGLPSGGSRSDATRGAIHKHGTTRLAAVAPPRATADTEIMDGRDKPGHDEHIIKSIG